MISCNSSIRSLFTIAILILFDFFCVAIPEQSYAQDIQVVTDNNNIPFLLDKDGFVWGFKNPDTLKNPFQLPVLSGIKQIVPFGALRRDGRVFVWDMDRKTTWQPELDGAPVGRIASYTTAKMVPGLTDVVALAGIDHHFAALLKNGSVVEWGRVLNKIEQDHDAPIPAKDMNLMLQTRSGLGSIKSIAVGERTVFALNDQGIVFEWGVSDLLVSKNDNHSISFQQRKQLNVGRSSKQLYTIKNYLIVLSSDGTARFWGSCSNNSAEGPIKFVEGDIDSVRNIKKVIISSGMYIDPVAYLLNDGTVIFPATPSFQSTDCEGQFSASNVMSVRTFSGASIIDASFPQGVYGQWALLVGDDGSITTRALTP